MTPEAGRAGAPAHFDDALFAADVTRLPDAGRAALVAARSRLERDGVPADERRHCSAEHPSGTRLPGCLKLYVPSPAGPWRIVFQVIRLLDGRLGLEYLAGGVAHLPREARRRDVYELAHYRLHGQWPERA